MTSKRRTIRRCGPPLATLLLCAGLVAGATPAHASSSDPVPTLNRHAQALASTEPGGDTGDLRTLGAAIGNAGVVGVGEATHSSHEFFSTKHRIFRYLVERKGFRAFALEGDWSSGLRINDYVLGKGGPGDTDLHRILREEFPDFWNNQEYFDLIQWMRNYNKHHASKVHFVGDDIGHPGRQLFDIVSKYLQRARPDLVADFGSLDRAIRPTTGVKEYMDTYMKRPVEERQRYATQSQRIVDALSKDSASRDGEWARQNARVIAQFAAMYNIDFNDPSQEKNAMLIRDRAMADNVAWWHEQKGEKVMLSAHNAHVAYETYLPEEYPKMQGAFLRELLGKRYVNIGFSFDSGSFNAQDDDGKMRVFTVGAAAAGSNEYALNQVSQPNYFVDLRKLSGSARLWLATKRPTRVIGTGYPEPDHDMAIGSSYDLLINLEKITPAHLLPTK